jgi:hypothetical protein
MRRAWNGDLLGVIVNLDSDGFLIVLRRGLVMAVLAGRNLVTSLPRCRVEDLAGANLEVLLC